MGSRRRILELAVMSETVLGLETAVGRPASRTFRLPARGARGAHRLGEVPGVRRAC